VKKEYQIVSFIDSKALRKWLLGNHAKVDGVWLQIYKKGSGVETVTYAEALDEALCFGWIDGQRKSHDSVSFLQKFTPRRKRSIWSKRNIEHVQRLLVEGKMTQSGLTEIQSAQEDGRWELAYDSPATMSIPEDFLRAIRKNKNAYSKFKTLSKSKLFSIYFLLHTAKSAESRQKRMVKIINDLEER
jgi:uncharacterized protein YdeI (YjbR/CyaY-like superfamily)